MSVVESLKLSPVRKKKRRNDDEVFDVEKELSKYFLPAYEPRQSSKREHGVLERLKEKEKMYNEAYEEFRKKKESKVKMAQMKRFSPIKRKARKKHKSEADLLALKRVGALGEYAAHPMLRHRQHALNKVNDDTKRRMKALLDFKTKTKNLEEARRKEYFSKRAKREKEIHDKLAGSKMLLKDKATYEKTRRLRPRNRMLALRDIEDKKRMRKWEEKNEKMKVVELGKSLLKDQQAKYQQYTRLRREVYQVQLRDVEDFDKRYGTVDEHPLVKHFVNTIE